MKAFLTAVAAVCLAASAAVAAPPPGKGKPPTTGPGCKPSVTVILKGTLATTPGQTATALSVTVKFATADGTAKTSFNDYVAKSGTLTFNPGETSKLVQVTINGDTIEGVNENLFVNLNTPTNATILDGQGVGNIINDD